MPGRDTVDYMGHGSQNREKNLGKHQAEQQAKELHQRLSAE